MKYHGTDIEVMLGDRVIYRHLFFGKSNGVAAYIPGVSEVNPRIIPNQWVVKLANGKGVFMLFAPELEFAHRRILFVERGSVDDVIKASDPV
ncbi:MAG: hypothetical protein PHE83_11435 [Opitutaceae bacterium]|nr:hypothetical protein [Opitutaceae bacterium]